MFWNDVLERCSGTMFWNDVLERCSGVGLGIGHLLGQSPKAHLALGIAVKRSPQ
jgi:hypothetical protein